MSADEIEPAAGWLGDADFFSDERDRSDLPEDRDRRVVTFTRQVCVRLSAAQHSELEQAAELYGVAPGTMARILVRRGSRAVLDYHRRYDLQQDLPD
jgi:hypothetical protein